MHHAARPQPDWCWCVTVRVSTMPGVPDERRVKEERTLEPRFQASSTLSKQLRVALLVDYPILMRAVRATNPDAVPRLGDIVNRARQLGAVVISRAYGAWYDVDEATNAFTEGLDPRFVPAAGPGNVPTTSMLVAEGLALLDADLVDALALSGDDRLLPLVTAASERER